MSFGSTVPSSRRRPGEADAHPVLLALGRDFEHVGVEAHHFGGHVRLALPRARWRSRANISGVITSDKRLAIGGVVGRLQLAELQLGLLDERGRRRIRRDNASARPGRASRLRRPSRARTRRRARVTCGSTRPARRPRVLQAAARPAPRLARSQRTKKKPPPITERDQQEVGQRLPTARNATSARRGRVPRRCRRRAEPARRAGSGRCRGAAPGRPRAAAAGAAGAVGAALGVFGAGAGVAWRCGADAAAAAHALGFRQVGPHPRGGCQQPRRPLPSNLFIDASLKTAKRKGHWPGHALQYCATFGQSDQ